MQIAPFELERWQSVWENRVELNISESGVEPLTVRDLLDDSAATEMLLGLRLGYPQTNGSEGLRERRCAQQQTHPAHDETPAHRYGSFRE